MLFPLSPAPFFLLDQRKIAAAIAVRRRTRRMRETTTVKAAEEGSDTFTSTVYGKKYLNRYIIFSGLRD